MNSKLNTFQRVRTLQKWQAALFASALLERMLPNYQLFSQLTDFGDHKQMRACLDCVWEWLAHPQASINFELQWQKVESNTPYAIQFDVYPAIEFCMGLGALIQLILDEDPQGAVVVSKLSQGGVEAYIAATEQDGTQQTKHHPLMQWEVKWQNNLLDKLESSQTSSTDKKVLITTLRTLAMEEGVSNIGLDMDS
jgi:uncharacterized protein YjaG (DUF416 family)